ncbi:phosphosulfolactate synthase [Paraconexibacter antarcticus]|uniref:Phosphosulfolactate synthase n=1 Tax=Paraconexibacter antarcticus TaxID=2949664 RepID=A0ABY5DTY0_9ACTN|nr:phosphosulfolactate synthase [Paraconexibacter antarcticus]UTI64738.1 phosphosulfolactate synthase [Paraconexibacter antarcticus]
MPALPDVFPLPGRAPKPRATGLTHVLDQGLGPAEVTSLLAVAGPHIDLVRLGWGSAFVTANLPEKLAAYREGGVPVMVGGTITELAWLHGRVDELRAWLHAHAIDRVEVSSGVVPIPTEEKHALITLLAKDFTVYAEVGEKDSDAILAPYRWVQLIREALAAGAELVVCEGRATGTAGLYRADGEARTGLIDEIVHEVPLEQLVFEAPRKDQQSWLINRFGGGVNLGNVPPSEVISLESLRLGLRADTLPGFHSRKTSA